MCQNTKNMKITPVTDICSKGDFVKKRVLIHPLHSLYLKVFFTWLQGLLCKQFL